MTLDDKLIKAIQCLVDDKGNRFAVAKELQISPTTVNKWLNGQSKEIRSNIWPRLLPMLRPFLPDGFFPVRKVDTDEIFLGNKNAFKPFGMDVSPSVKEDAGTFNNANLPAGEIPFIKKQKRMNMMGDVRPIEEAIVGAMKELPTSYLAKIYSSMLERIEEIEKEKANHPEGKE